MFKAVMLSPAFGFHLISSVEVDLTILVIMYFATLVFLIINWVWSSYLRKIANAKADIKKQEMLDETDGISQRTNDKGPAGNKNTAQELED